MNYTSFLICFHPNHTDVYREGLPLGVIRGGKFEVHQHTMPDGSRHSVVIDPNLLRQVEDAIQAMKCPSPTSPQSREK